MSKSRKCPHARRAAKKRAQEHVETIRGNLDKTLLAETPVIIGTKQGKHVRQVPRMTDESGVLASMSPRFNDPVGGVFKSKIIDRKPLKPLQRQLIFHPDRVEIVPCVIPSRVDGKKCRRFGRD